MYTPLVDDAGELAAEFTEDGLHLNERGYGLWAARLAPWLDGMVPSHRGHA